MSLIVDRRVEFYASCQVTPEVPALKAVQAAYNQAVLDAAHQTRTPVLIEVIVRVAPQQP